MSESLNELPIPRMTSEEFVKYCNLDVDDPVLTEWMKGKGISFDTGLIPVYLDGKIEHMNTSRKDFGTIVYSNEDILGAKGARKRGSDGDTLQITE